MAGFGNFVGFFSILQDPQLIQIASAVLVIAVGTVLAKVSGKALFYSYRKKRLGSKKNIQSFSRMLELFIFIVSIILALSVLKVSVAETIVLKFWGMVPSLIVLVLLLFLGYIVINLIVEFLKTLTMRIGSIEYLKEFGLSKSVVQNSFNVLKIFLLLVLLSTSFTYVGFEVPFINAILTAMIYAFVFFSAALILYTFKDYWANMLLSGYIEKNVLKPGQHLKLEDGEGEVVGASTHGTMVKLTSGYNLLIPNREVVNQRFLLKRVRGDIKKLESIASRFTCQLPSYCGPASTQMMLNFFGFDFSQEKIGKLSGTKVPGGVEPAALIETVKKLTNGEVKGHLIGFDEIYDLKEEMKSWIAEGALVLLWYKKPVLFPDKQSKKGHYVLCAGVEGNELIVMDPSPETAGVFMIDYKLLEDAMDRYDKMRGYIVFAKKGTSAFWRLNEGLIYSDVSAYRNLSKSFERYLNKLVRKKSMLSDLISEHLLPLLKSDEPIKRVWKPDLTQTKAKQEEEKKEANVSGKKK